MGIWLERYRPKGIKLAPVWTGYCIKSKEKMKRKDAARTAASCFGWKNVIQKVSVSKKIILSVSGNKNAHVVTKARTSLHAKDSPIHQDNGININEARPHDKLPYRGAWLWVGSEMIHLMELPNPDPPIGRHAHGGRDRHTCIAICDVSKLKTILDKAGIPYTLSRSVRPAIFTRPGYKCIGIHTG
ncbi:hypothetical protein E3N88_40776 [Mikania micrantha]|uniref:Uncharacterized protein n=1 Tax=Mikania micrantha TaxID=192012 RepID=A0A5N6LNN8_9ASTR|nr:hypothetical protein E3N88_40776 [Mikania micrantha]